MDVEKLIERLYKHHTDWGEGRTQDFFEVCLDCKDAATALSTLQAENEKLRETVDKYATAARVIALHLKPFCDESLPYDEMIADAARKASDELEQVKRDRDAARSDIETALAYGMKDCELCKNSQCYVRGGTKPCLPKWRGQKEDCDIERLSDRAIEIINELHTERLDYESEYLPLIDCAQKCQAYEDTGLEPEGEEDT